MLKTFLTRTLPKYLESLPIPDTVAELRSLDQDEAIALIMPVVTIIVLLLTFRGVFAGEATALRGVNMSHANAHPAHRCPLPPPPALRRLCA